jgi:hypothetical protein
MSSIIKVDQIQNTSGGAPTATDLGINTTGNVLQIVQSVKSDTFSTTSASFVEITGYNVTITPASSSNKVMVDVCLHVGESQDAFPVFRMYRNGVELQIASVISPGTSGMFGKTTTQNSARDQYLLEPVNFKFIDSPNTTGAVTYTFRVRPMGASSRIVFVNRSQTIGDSNQYTVISTLTATEIAG